MPTFQASKESICSLAKTTAVNHHCLKQFFLACGQSNPLLPLNINNFRDYRKIQKKDISLDFYKLDTEKDIQISLYNEEIRNLTISFFEQVSRDIKLEEDSKSVESP